MDNPFEMIHEGHGQGHNVINNPIDQVCFVCLLLLLLLNVDLGWFVMVLVMLNVDASGIVVLVLFLLFLALLGVQGDGGGEWR